MKNFKKQNGITLVALVVTIIVLLILAGVSLSLVAGENGILKRATNAADANEIATAKEQAGLLISDLVTGYYEEKYVNHSIDGVVNSQLAYIVSQVGEEGKKTDNGNYTVKVVGPTGGATTGTITVEGGSLQSSSGKESLTGTISENGTITWN